MSGTVSQMVTNILYDQVLGRDADTPYLLADSAALDAGLSAATLRASLADSPEAASDIAIFYQAELGRSPAAAEVMLWQGALSAGLDLGAVRAAIAASPEAAAAVRAAFVQILGRNPGDQELVPFQAALAGGATLGALRTSIATSVEEIAKVTRDFVAIDGAPPTNAQLQLAEAAAASGQTPAQRTATIAYTPQVQGMLTPAYIAAFGHGPDVATLNAAFQALATGATFAQVVAGFEASAPPIPSPTGLTLAAKQDTSGGQSVTAVLQPRFFASEQDPSNRTLTLSATLNGNGVAQVLQDQGQPSYRFAATNPLPDGTYTLVATATNLLGESSAPSAPYVFTIEAAVPSVPTIDGPADVATASASDTVSGTADAGSTISVFVGQAATAQTATASAAGRWSVAVTLAPAADTVQAFDRSEAGVANPTGATQTVTFDATAAITPQTVSGAATPSASVPTIGQAMLASYAAALPDTTSSPATPAGGGTGGAVLTDTVAPPAIALLTQF